MIAEMSTAIVSAAFAGISALCALWGYYSERKIREDLKADEKLFIGKPHNPSFISLADHRDCVLEIPIHNVSTSKRAFITKVQAFDRKGEAFEMSWSGSTDKLGNFDDNGDIIKVTDSTNLYLRANDGNRIDHLCIKIFHTFSESAQVVFFDKYADLHE